MPLPGQLFAPTDADLVLELKRELTMRHQVYPRLVERGTMSQSEADVRIELMERAAKRLEELTK